MRSRDEIEEELDRVKRDSTYGIAYQEAKEQITLEILLDIRENQAELKNKITNLEYEIDRIQAVTRRLGGRDDY